MEEFKNGVQEKSAEIPKKALYQTVNELIELGIIEADEATDLIEVEDSRSPISSKDLLWIISNAKKNSIREVEDSLTALKGHTITCHQARVILQEFKYSTIEWKEFFLGCLPNLSDPENFENMLKQIRFHHDFSSRSHGISTSEVKNFMDTVKACYPDGIYYKPEPKRLAKEEESEYLGMQYVEIVGKRELTPFAVKAIKISWALMIINIILMLALLIF
jgi:hypothetical protein